MPKTILKSIGEMRETQLNRNINYLFLYKNDARLKIGHSEWGFLY